MPGIRRGFGPLAEGAAQVEYDSPDALEAEIPGSGPTASPRSSVSR